MLAHLLLLCLLLSACDQEPAPSMDLVGEARAFAERKGNPQFQGGYLVEAHFVSQGDKVFVLTQTQDLKVGMARADEMASGPPPRQTILDDPCRFPYVFQDRGTYFLICTRSTGSGDVYLYRSDDLVTWEPANDGHPIVTRAPGTVWADIWNVAIVPVGDRWYMLAETNHYLNRMGLAFAYADVRDGRVDFDSHRSIRHVIAGGGNPELMLLDDKLTLAAIHGVFRDPERFGGNWYVTVSTADLAAPDVWMTHRDGFAIGRAGIDVADPTTIEIGGRTLLAVSYDQKHLYLLEANGSLRAIQQRLAGR